MSARSWSTATLLLAVSLLTPHRMPAAEAADVILHHGKVVTVNEQFSVVEAIAWRGDRILAVGSDEKILQLRGENTQVVDLGGKMVLPGLMDSHTHPTGAAMFEFDHPVPEMETIADVLQYVAARTKAVPAGDWIWVNQVFITRLREQRFPTKQELDAIAPDHPVVFSTGPDAMVNSLALRLSGIGKDFQVTGTGEIERDPQTGEPTGMLRGNTKRYLKSKSSAKGASEAQRADRLAELLHDYNSVGITSIADRDASESGIQLFQRLRGENRLTVRVAFSHGVNAQNPLPAIREAIQKVATHPLRKSGDEWLRVVGIKTYQDGGMLTGSAYMSQPWGVSDIYSIRDPQYRGMLFIPIENLRDIVRATVEQGLQFTAHTVGDGAVQNLVNVYEELSQTLPVRETRPSVTHCNFMSREAVEKMGRLGVVCDIQPAWLYLDARTLQAQFGYDRLRYFQPLKSLFAAGVKTGGGSDHMQKIGSLRSINPYNPFLGMATTVTRRGRWYDGQLHLEEALSREQAIRFYTSNNAYILFLDQQTGSLEPGKLADVIVVDRDLLTCPAEEITGTQVLRTYVGGKLVHQKE